MPRKPAETPTPPTTPADDAKVTTEPAVEMETAVLGTMYRHMAMAHRLTDYEIRLAMNTGLDDDEWAKVKAFAGM